MEIKKIKLGKTGLWVTKTAMGCLPIQRISHEAARELLRKAYDSGINYYDTANAYTDSEEKSAKPFMTSGIISLFLLRVAEQIMQPLQNILRHH